MARILLVDDDAAVRRATTIVLEAKGFEVVAAGDGRSAVEAVKTDRFDAAIVDLFMPGMDGLKTTEAIRKLDPSLAIIAASGFMFRGGECPTMPHFDAMATQAGAAATLYKPFRPAALLGALEVAIAATVKDRVA